MDKRNGQAAAGESASVNAGVERLQNGFNRVEVLPPPQSESDIYRRISDAMILAGIRALGEWEACRDAGRIATDRDLVCAVFVAMSLRC